MKAPDFLKESPTLSGDEEVVARAGEGVEDPWSKEDQNPGILGIRPLDEKGKITKEYKFLLEELRMDLPTIKPYQQPKPSEEIEKANKEWKRLQKNKSEKDLPAIERIKRWRTIEDNRKGEEFEKYRLEQKERQNKTQTKRKGGIIINGS